MISKNAVFIAVLFLLLVSLSAVVIAEPVALVLGGGGARGAYQIGVWKALREMDVEIGSVYGVSVGAINGAIIASDDYDMAERLWLTLEKSNVMDLGEVGQRLLDGELFEQQGLNVEPLELLLENNIHEDKVRSSGIDYGLVTWSVTDRVEKLLYLDDIPEGQLVDYILASANFPLFERKIIDGEVFIDGGVYKNLAVEMIDSGEFKDAVLVSLDFYGYQDVIDYLTNYSGYGLNIKFIRPQEYSGSLLDFSPENAALLIKMGYLDGLRAFGKVAGNQYYIQGEADFIKKMYLSLNAEQRRTAAELLEINDLPDSRYFIRDGCYYRYILPAMRKVSEDDIDFLDRYAAKRDIYKYEIYTPHELLGKTVDDYIHRAINSIYYNPYLDFLSYLYLESFNQEVLWLWKM